MRDYTNFDIYLNELVDDIYPQPVDEGHTRMSLDVINKWIPKVFGCKSVVDMGCGQVALQEAFERYGLAYTGVAIGVDVILAKEQGKNIINTDMTFSGFADKSFEMVYSRHSLEHSPFPLLTLMEWHRIAQNWLLLVLPSTEVYQYTGLNHYGVMNIQQARFFLERAKWKVIWEDDSEKTELRFLCEKLKPK